MLASGPAVIETKLGWTVFGKNGMPEISDNSTLLVTSMLNKKTLISDLWSLDALGILDLSEKKNKLELQEEARDHFLSTVKVNKEGLFQIPNESNRSFCRYTKSISTKSLYPKDKDYLRFLWYGTDGKLKYYRHCRVVFGVTSSVFLLVSVIHYLLESSLNELNGNPKYKVDIIEQLKKSFYVDDCLASLKNELELQQFIQVASDTLAARKLELLGWEYSDPTDNSSSITSVLGMEKLSYRTKLFLCVIIALTSVGMLYFFYKHRVYCEELAFSWFALCEYVICFANMAFHATIIWDLPDEEIVICLPLSHSSPNCQDVTKKNE
ncbi:hypothetical protein AVEN_159127-1 [Araneus ventricosus]|uniref:CWH43-like N-terminal domain-containing protein n=1 Tax=Araneus ventricosus TaxID=182803 RepID=A0A4Y2B9U4_ARAVE|nr:hypothetical protein AVEN_159127-1 [Araneus ventricosus]